MLVLNIYSLVLGLLFGGLISSAGFFLWRKFSYLSFGAIRIQVIPKDLEAVEISFPELNETIEVQDDAKKKARDVLISAIRRLNEAVRRLDVESPNIKLEFI